MTIGKFRSIYTGIIYIENSVKDDKGKHAVIRYTPLLAGSGYDDVVIQEVVPYSLGVKIITDLPDIVFKAWKKYSDDYYRENEIPPYWEN